ncbi:MAG: SRPBCC family protein [Candidatus Hydrogenedentes bacterium]|nr:SRPBCC family protein [Candidatus Hydrogenedentota bacterium]MCH8843740.1 SRPBCC family protein [SAR324 cluster bacterium]
MSTVSVSRKVNVPAEKVWKILSDFGGVHKFHPLVERSPLKSDNNSGLGSTRVCHFYDKTSITEKVVKWNEGRGYTVEISDMSMPLKKAQARLQVEPADGDTCLATMEMTYVVKFGVLGVLMDKMMISGKMRQMFASILEGLERNATTGDLIGENGISLGKTGAAQLQPAG